METVAGFSDSTANRNSCPQTAAPSRPCNNGSPDARSSFRRAVLPERAASMSCWSGCVWANKGKSENARRIQVRRIVELTTIYLRRDRSQSRRNQPAARREGPRPRRSLVYDPPGLLAALPLDTSGAALGKRSNLIDRRHGGVSRERRKQSPV